MSLIGWLTASVSDTTMALVEDGALLGSRQLDMGNSGLQHYSPYKVAENFNVLASLAPGRVDLGIGGGPGGLPPLNPGIAAGNRIREKAAPRETA